MSVLALVVGWAVAALVMAAAWFWQRRTRNAAVVDVAWTVSTGALAVAYSIIATGPLERRALLCVLTATWALRLSWHLLPRMFGHEDPRYRTLREEWADSADRRFFRFFQSQALAAPLFAAVAGIAADAPGALSAWDAVGAAIALLALGGEWLADRQLSQFRTLGANRGRVCDAGLWRYTRHPNYFFEWLFWWSFLPLAITSRWWWLTLAPPAAMYYFLNFVTGIPPAEAQAVASRGDQYLAYQRRTSAFIPWPPSL
jgi:steroid 5-alpha reductase family enzyme